MNRSDILKWMTAYSPVEQEFKEYYQLNHHPVSETHFFQILQKHHGLESGVDQVFKNVDAIVIPSGDNSGDSSEFSDMTWMQKKQDISIRKHPRFLPPLKHSHTFIEISYVFSGSCRQVFYFDSGLTEEITLTSSMLCIIPPKLEHMIAVYDDSIIINILIKKDVMKQTLTNLVAGNHVLFDFFIYTLYENSVQNFMLFDTKQDEAIEDLLLGMMVELCEDKPYTQNITHLMLGLIFAHLQRDYSDQIQFSRYATSGIDYIPQILSYMKEHYQTTSVEDIAKHFYISHSYLSRIFKQYTNSTVVQALQKIRLQAACDYLINTSLSVQKVAELAGYTDVTFFIRIFKKAFGITPLQYRKEKLSLCSSNQKWTV